MLPSPPVRPTADYRFAKREGSRVKSYLVNNPVLKRNIELGVFFLCWQIYRVPQNNVYTHFE